MIFQVNQGWIYRDRKTLVTLFASRPADRLRVTTEPHQHDGDTLTLSRRSRTLAHLHNRRFG